ncbi:phosphotransferase family protein [Aspergillus homomorphus CBS 101889]|uniref:Altered inheritance of mitochondria protein 9, mitochondrial n=1 Tax=Aspergillus homomorphus (strain CBS 101889) TaxID=1450537 RepID=A0A395HYJ7_ASPHC|nr:phosphotransferase enzyme family protein [Aspergillus homomorphus CBS 101889]RAL12777.1 phosphotransferase enzyme family protein [Aspergillus homomorphus CBS 101889]
MWGLQRPHSISSRPTHSHDFNYTSGCWLIIEAHQLERRHIRFDVPALQGIAGQLIGSRCVRMYKIPEGLFNKVFSLHMETGKEILARIPNPNAGHPHYMVASEVASLDFLRNVLEIPVPRVLAWSSSSQPNPVGAEYILMERVEGRQLGEIWDDILYYRSTFPQGRSIVAMEGANLEGQSKCVLGPTTQRSFWENEMQAMEIDRGPWATAQEYLAAVASREIARIQNAHSGLRNVTVPPGKTQQKRDNHIKLLGQFLAVLPHILPPAEILSPVLLHPDLHSDNIFVDASDPTQISSIIDWQAVHAAPLFMQTKFPSIFNCDDIYPWGAVQPQLPNDYDSLSQEAKKQAEDKVDRLRLKKFYELASRTFNPALIHAMDQMRNENDPTTFIFYIVGQSFEDGPLPLTELLIQVFEKWDQITERRGSREPCPISFSRQEIDESRRQIEAWAAAFGDFKCLRAELLGEDGWVSHDDYEEAMGRWEEHKTTLETLRKRLETLC